MRAFSVHGEICFSSPHTRISCYSWQKISNMFDIWFICHEWQKHRKISPHTRKYCQSNLLRITSARCKFTSVRRALLIWYLNDKTLSKEAWLLKRFHAIPGETKDNRRSGNVVSNKKNHQNSFLRVHEHGCHNVRWKRSIHIVLKELCHDDFVVLGQFFAKIFA